MDHFIPTDLSAGAAALIGSVAEEVLRPVSCSEPLVESGIVDAPEGMVIPLINWSAGPVSDCEVHLIPALTEGATVTLATGQAVAVESSVDETTFTLDLDIADAIIVRLP